MRFPSLSLILISSPVVVSAVTPGLSQSEMMMIQLILKSSPEQLRSLVPMFEEMSDEEIRTKQEQLRALQSAQGGTGQQYQPPKMSEEELREQQERLAEAEAANRPLLRRSLGTYGALGVSIAFLLRAICHHRDLFVCSVVGAPQPGKVHPLELFGAVLAANEMGDYVSRGLQWAWRPIENTLKYLKPLIPREYREPYEKVRDLKNVGQTVIGIVT